MSFELSIETLFVIIFFILILFVVLSFILPVIHEKNLSDFVNWLNEVINKIFQK